jgi:hypothetical protein
MAYLACFVYFILIVLLSLGIVIAWKQYGGNAFSAIIIVMISIFLIMLFKYLFTFLRGVNELYRYTKTGNIETASGMQQEICEEETRESIQIYLIRIGQSKLGLSKPQFDALDPTVVYKLYYWVCPDSDEEFVRILSLEPM